MALQYPGQNASQAQIAQWMGARAQAAGLPRELPVMAGLVESNLANLNHGDRDSLGFFQMRSSIWNQGAYRGYANNPDLQMQWFIDQAKRASRGGSLGDWVANIERPAEQYRGRYQTRLAEAQKLLGMAASGGGATAPAASMSHLPPSMPQAPATPTLNTTLGSRSGMIQRLLDSNAQNAGIPGLVLPQSSLPQMQMAAPPQPAALPAGMAGQPAGLVPGGGPPSDAAAFIKGGRPSQIGDVRGLPGQGTHSYTEGPNNWQSDNAVDVYMPVGTPLYATTDGTVNGRFGSLGKGGRFAGLRMTIDGPGNSFYYAHLSRFAPGIKPGAHVRLGQLIGYSGEANGVAHLHLGALHGNPASLYGR